MAISKIHESDLENITNIMGVPLAGWIHFIPNEFSGPLGAEWVDDPTNNGTYEVAGGQLVTTQSGTDFINIYQVFEDPSFDIWTKFNVTNTSLSGVYNRYNVGGIFMFPPPFEEWTIYPGLGLYLQYNYDTATEYSLAIYLDENPDSSFAADPYTPDGFDIYNPEIYFRIKYEVGDFVRVYWSQGGEWIEINTGVNVVLPKRKLTVLSGFCNQSPVNNTTSFDFIRKHDEIPFEPEV